MIDTIYEIKIRFQYIIFICSEMESSFQFSCQKNNKLHEINIRF